MAAAAGEALRVAQLLKQALAYTTGTSCDLLIATAAATGRATERCCLLVQTQLFKAFGEVQHDVVNRLGSSKTQLDGLQGDRTA